MKRIIALLALILAPALSFAQTNAQQNEAGATFLPSAGQTSTNIAVDRALRQIVSLASGTNGPLSIVPVSNATGLNGVGAGLVGWRTVTFDVIEAGSTSTVLNLTAHAALVGDIVRFSAVSESGTTSRQWSTVCSTTANTVTLCNALSFTPTNPQDVMIMRATPAGVTANSGSGFTGLNVNVTSSLDSGATNLLKLEDAASASGDALVGVAAIRNDNMATGLSGTNGDYTPISVDSNGGLFLSYGTANSPLKQEDQVVGNQDTGMAVFGLNTSAISATSAVGDYGWVKLDEGGRTIATMAPAGEMTTSCSVEVTNTTSTTIVAPLASNRFYVTSINCSNNSAVASRLSFQDGVGGTVRAVGGVGTLAATGGGWNKTFPVPLRLTTNTALAFAPATTATATICCATGYYSTI